MLWSLKFTGDAEMKTAHLLLLQTKLSMQILHGGLLLAVRNCSYTSPPLQTDAAQLGCDVVSWGCSIPAQEGGKEGGSSRVGRQALPSQPFPISDHMVDMQKIPVSLETGSFCMCCSESGKFAFIKPPW